MASYRRGRDELTVGLYVLAAVAVFVILFGALTSRGLIRNASDLYVAMTSAEGLLKGDAVLYRGVPVGEVRSIDFSESHGVLVRARLRREVPLTNAAAAALTPVDMFGRQAIVLREGRFPGTAALTSGDTLIGEQPRPLTERVSDVGDQVERFLGDPTLTRLHAALDGIGDAAGGLASLGDEATSLLAAQRRSVHDIGAASSAVARNLAAATDSVELVLLRAELFSAVRSLAQATARMDSASASAASVFAKLDRGEGSLGRLVNDAQLYERTASAVTTLEQLAADIRRDPKRYISLKVF
jgi:phospholipid/cholesterol/gamma-HCH transport system substrate-binding protein